MDENTRLAIAFTVLVGSGILYLLLASSFITGWAMNGATSEATTGKGTAQIKAFVSGNAKTTGTGRLVTKDGKTYVELRKDLTLSKALDIVCDALARRRAAQENLRSWPVP